MFARPGYEQGDPAVELRAPRRLERPLDELEPSRGYGCQQRVLEQVASHYNLLG